MIYENWSLKRIEDSINDRNYLLKFLGEYLNYKWKTRINIEVYDYFFDGKNFIIHYSDEFDQYSWTVDDINELINFLDEPELLKKTKKYNL